MEKNDITKMYLMRYINALKEHGKIAELYTEVCEAIGAIGGFSYSERVMSSRKYNASFEEIVARKDALERKMYQQGIKVVEIHDELKKQIEAVENPRSRWILLSLYIQRTSWNDLFEHGERTERSYYNWHRQALGDFYDRYREEIKEWLGQ